MSEHAGPEWYFFRVTRALPGEETEVSLVGTGVSLGAGAPTPHHRLRLPPLPQDRGTRAGAVFKENVTCNLQSDTRTFSGACK